MHASSFGSERRDAVIRVVPEGDAIVAICLEGDFDLSNAAALGKEVDRALKKGNNLILDLSRATFIDSSVVHVLVRASEEVSRSERAVVVQLGTAAVVERVLEIAEIERVLPRAHDRQEAVRIIQGQAETPLSPPDPRATSGSEDEMDTVEEDIRSLIVYFPDGTKEFPYPLQPLAEGDVVWHDGERYRVLSVLQEDGRPLTVTVEPDSEKLGDIFRSERGGLRLVPLE
jgi:anti-anti-sigma factor